MWAKGLFQMFFPLPASESRHFLCPQVMCEYITSKQYQAHSPTSADVLLRRGQCRTIYRMFHIFTASVCHQSQSVNSHEGMWLALRYVVITAQRVNGKKYFASEHQLCTSSAISQTLPGRHERTSWLAPAGLIVSVHTLVWFVFIYLTGTCFSPP